MARSPVWHAALVCSALAGCATPESPGAEGGAALALGTELHVLEVLADRPERIDDPLALTAPVGLADLGHVVVITDPPTDRLVFFDPELRPIRQVGGSGAGPGELDGPFELRRREGRLYVSELDNGRVSVFGADGSFERILPAGNTGSGFDVLPDESVIVQSSDARSLLMRHSSGAPVRPFGELPEDLVRDRPVLGRRGVRPVVLPDGRTVVFDSDAGTVITLEPGGLSQSRAAIPPEIWDAVIGANEEAEAGLRRGGLSPLPGSVYRSVSAVDSFTVLAVVALPALPALLFDLREGHVRAVRVQDTTGAYAHLARAVSGDLRGDTLTILHTLGITRYRVGERR